MATIGGINLGNLTDYLFFFADGRTDANWQGATKGFAGDVAVDGLQAKERTSGGVPFAGTIYTNDTTLDAWQGIVNQNSGQAFGSTGNVELISQLETTLNNAFTSVNALRATDNSYGDFSSVSSTSLNGLNTTDGIAQTFVINVTSGLQVSSQINITGDPGDFFIIRWDKDANFGDGYEGQVKFQSGGAIIPLGGLSPSNFIHVAGDINSSGGGSTPSAFNYPQGPRRGNGQGALPTGAKDFSGGGFFTGYWLTTGKPDNPADATHSVPYGESSSMSNGIFVGGWYTINTKFSMTSGTSGVHVGPVDYGDLPEPKYNTTRKVSGPSGPGHVITDTLFMGLNFATDIDAEGNGQPNATATGDNLVNQNDEKAVTIPTLLAGEDATFKVSVTNKTGQNATLYGFIDWNMDGDFADTGETATAIVANNTMGNVPLTFSVPAGAVVGMDLGARFRLSTAAGLGPTDPAGANGPIPAPDGEVEDYLVQVGPPSASIGDFVWNDLNANGIQEAGEPGIPNVTVKLLTAGADGNFGTPDDVIEQTQTTDATGMYMFSDLTPGVAYQVEFIRPTNYISFTKTNQGTDDKDSDADVTTGRAPIVVLDPDETNLTIDAGLVKAAGIGDRVWEDTNGNGCQDPGEQGLAGLKVTLNGFNMFDQQVTGEIWTGADGKYLFNGLLPGTYTVKVSKPGDYDFSPKDDPNCTDDKDSDVNTLGYTDPVKLGSDEINRTVDAGLVPLRVDLSIEKTDGLATVKPGDQIKYTITVKNGGPGTVNSVIVNDDLPDGFLNPVFTPSTGTFNYDATSGKGEWTGLNLGSDDSVELTLTGNLAGIDGLTKLSEFSLFDPDSDPSNNDPRGQNLGQSITVQGIIADAFYIDSGHQYQVANLWQRYNPNDNGLGVSSYNEPDPLTSGGDVNELSNQQNKEVIRLTKADGERWTALWVSSLDENGTNNAEKGRVYWSDSPNPDLRLLPSTSSFAFNYHDFGPSVEGDILTLNQSSGFDRTAKYLFFVAGENATDTGTNNDYLVWKATTGPAKLINTATVEAPLGFTDPNPINNSATDTDGILYI